jgi:hypothetical protein
MDMQENSESHPNAIPVSENEKDGPSELQIDTAGHKVDSNSPNNARETLFMIAITLTQLVQMIPLGAGINSGLSIGESLGATNVQSAWIVASYPLTQGAFILIGKHSLSSRTSLFAKILSYKVAAWELYMVIRIYSRLVVSGGLFGPCVEDSQTTWYPCAS